ncbi:MAG: endolytic transglycosylase MltG [Patescibacteria group bacterium]
MTLGTESPHQPLPHHERRFRRRLLPFFILCFAILLASGFLLFHVLNQPPHDFPTRSIISIEKGMNVSEIATSMAEQKVVRSKLLLYISIVLLYDETTIKASNYVFEKPLTTRRVAERLVQGDFDTDLVRLTHIEGERATDLAESASEILVGFDTVDFLSQAVLFEGRLFPDTYFIPSTYTEKELLALLTDTFAKKMEPLQAKIASSTLSLDEILILASIIEREANTLESKRAVSSVLQNRLAIGMPLQADASIEYVLDKPLSELTADDLKIESPYNTYLHTGLPPTPIGNPGLEAIEAVLLPEETDYFYYISDERGQFYYAKTYNEHLINIERHLR